MRSRVAVVGGGMAGLTTAYRLLTGGSEPRPEVTVVEADSHAGGKVRSVRVGGLDLEAGPDSFVARKPWAVDLCRELGLGEGVVTPGTSGTLLWTNKGLVPFLRYTALGVPADFNELVRWGRGLSWAGRLRALSDLFRKPRVTDGDESVGSLVRRRLGDEVTERLVQPLIGGLFAGDVDRLSVRATFPELAAWERERGSMIRGARAAVRKATQAGPQPMFVKLRDGTELLAEALAAAVGEGRILRERRAGALRREGGAYAVEAGDTSVRADAVVLATPAFETARLLEGIAPAAVPDLLGIPYISTGVVILVYPEGSAPDLPDVTGFVVPAGEASMTACTFVSRKWPHPAFGNRSVVRCYVGGAGAEDILEASDEELVEGVGRQLAAVLPLPPAPEFSGVVRWERSMPQYEVGHLDRVRRIDETLPEGIFVAGAAYGGVGIPDVVRQAGEVAERARAHLRPAGR